MGRLIVLSDDPSGVFLGKVGIIKFGPGQNGDRKKRNPSAFLHRQLATTLSQVINCIIHFGITIYSSQYVGIEDLERAGADADLPLFSVTLVLGSGNPSG